jgi:hypothetical protein
MKDLVYPLGGIVFLLARKNTSPEILMSKLRSKYALKYFRGVPQGFWLAI